MSAKVMRVSEQMAVEASAPVRGTQSFVHTLLKCWNQSALTGIEILWPLGGRRTDTLGVCCAAEGHSGGAYGWNRSTLPGLGSIMLCSPILLAHLTADPMGAVTKINGAVTTIYPDLLRSAEWMIPIALVTWIVISSIGRTAVLRRADPGLVSRPLTLMGLQLIRMTALAGAFALWFFCLGKIADVRRQSAHCGRCRAGAGALLRVVDSGDAGPVLPLGGRELGLLHRAAASDAARTVVQRRA